MRKQSVAISSAVKIGQAGGVRAYGFAAKLSRHSAGLYGIDTQSLRDRATA